MRKFRTSLGPVRILSRNRSSGRSENVTSFTQQSKLRVEQSVSNEILPLPESNLDVDFEVEELLGQGKEKCGP